MFWLMGGQDAGFSFANSRAIMTGINLVVTLLQLVAWILLLFALFGWRKTMAAERQP
jgi:type IV secretory pathway TrbL component